MDRYWDEEKMVWMPVYFRYIIWRDLMNKAEAYHDLCHIPDREPGELWNSDRGAFMVFNQKMAAEFYRAARKVMDIE